MTRVSLGTASVLLHGVRVPPSDRELGSTPRTSGIRCETPRCRALADPWRAVHGLGQAHYLWEPVRCFCLIHKYLSNTHNPSIHPIPSFSASYPVLLRYATSFTTI